MTTIRFSVLLATAAFLAAPAFAQQSASTPHSMAGTSASGSADSPAAKVMMDSMHKMQKAMTDATMTGEADKDFVAMMIPHHVGAVDMAKIELQYGKDPEILKLARAVVAAQTKEIGLMKAWQARHPGR